MSTVVLLVGGLVALVVGAELLVRTATRLATALGVPPMVVGLTVVSIGTSMPELAIGIDAARQGSSGLAVGNIVGTNLVNILLILGLSALIAPIVLERRTLRFDLPAMTVAAVVLYVLAFDGALGPWDGVVLCLGAVAYTWGVLRAGRRDAADGDAATDPVDGPDRTDGTRGGSWALDALGLVTGIAVIVVGAELLVDGAVDAASSLGVSDAVIGLTVVAVGTSAPELVTTIVSTVRGDREIALGNLLGSSVYNIAFVLGVTVLAAPGDVEVPAEVLDADLVLLVAVALATVPTFLSGRRISRVEGGAFVAAYVGYLVWLLATRA
jgi:cation:H+ antiporter